MKVVVPISNTVSAQSMFDVLFAMKWVEGTEIKLVTVTSKWQESPDAEASSPALLQELEVLANDLRRSLPFCEVSYQVLEGNPKEQIVEFARDAKADLILIGSSENERTLQLFSESTTQTVISHAPCPVFVARENNVSTSDIQTGFKTVLIPADDSVYADAAIAWLLNFRWSPMTRFVLAGVIADPQAQGVAEQKLIVRAQKLSLALRTRVDVEVRQGDPAETIVDLVKAHGAELIVIGSHARKGIHKLLLGSVSEVLARTAPCPVAVIRGLVQEDAHWHRTGVFRRPKVRRPQFADVAYPSRSYSRSNDTTPHTMPSGMG